jgi:class 3 adenylate cyclase
MVHGEGSLVVRLPQSHRRDHVPEIRARQYPAVVAKLQRRKFDESQDVRRPPKGEIKMVELGDRVIGLVTFQPGWRWSIDMAPGAGTTSCQAHHLAYSVSGRAHIETNDGISMEIGPDEVFEIPPGHDAWVVGDEPWVSVDFEAMRGFGKNGEVAARRTLATVLMTDIVDSTARAVDEGQGRWQDLVRIHNERAERVIDQHEGRLIKTTGDGVIGLFDSAERAVRAGLAISSAVADLDLQIRAGVQTGEVELSAGDVRGVVVHATARMMSLAGAGEVVVSSTVRDLLDGTDFQFEDFGLHTLKGLPGERHLYRVTA